MSEATVVYRRGRADDSYAIFLVFEEALADLLRRRGDPNVSRWDDKDKLARLWIDRRPLFDFLAQAAAQFWVAERGERIVGYARAVLADGVWELTEFFVAPTEQSGGVGRELLSRVLPAEARQRLIIATTDARAQARYLKLGVYPRFPVMYWQRKPEAVTVDTDLEFAPLSPSAEQLAALDAIDRAVLGFARREEHVWLMSQFERWLYLRNGRPVGYGYEGRRNGPFALLDAVDFPAVLAHAETSAVGRIEEIGFEVPMINRVAVNYLLARGYRLDDFIAFVMTDEPLGRWENYIATSPPFFA
jgi:GNAT superfamily N-acetyltransferase